jgi:hypothetical protein
VVGVNAVVFVDEGPGSYPTSFFPAANGNITDPLWANEDVDDTQRDLINNDGTVDVYIGQRLVVYGVLENNSTVNCGTPYTLNVREFRLAETTDNVQSASWFAPGFGATTLQSVVWSSGTPGVIGPGQNAFGLWFFDVVTGLPDQTLRFRASVTYDSCNPEPGSCPGFSKSGDYPHPNEAPPVPGNVLTIVGPRAQVQVIQPAAPACDHR